MLRRHKKVEKNEEKKEYFINIQSFMTRKLGLKSNELIIYALIHGFCQDGHSFFFGSIKYIMDNANLSKETVLSVLQNLVKKGLIIKKDVKNYSVFDKTKNARGAQHFCLYYTLWSRQSVTTGKKTRPENHYETGNSTFTGQETRPNNKAYMNSTSTATDKHNELSDLTLKAEAEDIILKKLKELFGGHLVFDESFIPGILSLSKEFELEENQIQGFLQFVFDRASEKKPNSLTNMYYKMAKSPAVIQDYVLSLQKLQKETKSKDKDMALCPICGSSANVYRQCSCCNFDMLDRFDRKKVSIQKQIYELPKNDKEAFNREFEAELKRQKTFGVVAMLTNPTLRAEFQERLKNIYHKYGITA